MAIALFKHNRDAYKAVLKMLQVNGTAAVIYPAGTGKPLPHSGQTAAGF